MATRKVYLAKLHVDKLARASKVYALRQTGITLREVGEVFGHSRETVRQLCSYYEYQTGIKQRLNKEEKIE